jgi:hypothetical protein
MTQNSNVTRRGKTAQQEAVHEHCLFSRVAIDPELFFTPTGEYASGSSIRDPPDGFLVRRQPRNSDPPPLFHLIGNLHSQRLID